MKEFKYCYKFVVRMNWLC